MQPQAWVGAGVRAGGAAGGAGQHSPSVERKWCFQVDLGGPEGLLLHVADVSLRLWHLRRGHLKLGGVSCCPVCLSVCPFRSF